VRDEEHADAVAVDDAVREAFDVRELGQFLPVLALPFRLRQQAPHARVGLREHDETLRQAGFRGVAREHEGALALEARE
jgi:hypothetical protein